MELNQLKDLWKEENRQLEQRVELSETLLLKINLEKATGELDKLLNLSMLGRNLALLYCFVSVIISLQTWSSWAYCVPAMAAGLAMFGSFISHLPIKKPDYSSVSILALQEIICKFRMHTIALQPYDTGITIFWILTTFAGVLFKTANINLYSGAAPVVVWVLITLVTAGLILYSRFIYRDYDARLKRSGAQLDEVLTFEKNMQHELS